MQLSIIICTYNRSGMLAECLQSLTTQDIGDKAVFEVIIIDNNSSDNTQEIIDIFTTRFSNFRSHFEPKQGLSHARNRGCREAKSPWVVYIDDDAKVVPGFVERALWIIDKYDFDCFGGMYYAWYLQEKPKWIPKSFGNKSLLRESAGLIDGTNGWLSGGNFAIKKKVLENVGGFDADFGMSGDQIGYGEEDHLQQKLLERNYKIGFDPELVIYHAVLPHKLKLSWHLRSAYQHGITKEMLKYSKRSWLIPFFNLVWSFIGLFVKRLPLSLIKLAGDKNYYWQNLLLDTVQPLLRHYGSLSWNFKNSLKRDL